MYRIAEQTAVITALEVSKPSLSDKDSRKPDHTVFLNWSSPCTHVLYPG